MLGILRQFVLSVALLSAAVAAEMAGIGDSVMQSYRTGAWSTGQGWFEQTAARKGMTPHNFAQSGAYTSQMSSQLTAVLAMSPLPDCLLIGAGENDIPGTSVATFKSTLDGHVANAIAGGIPANHITLVTPFPYPPTSYMYAAPAYLAATHEIGGARGVAVVGFFERFAVHAVTRADYAQLANADGHPEIAGHRDLAESFSLPENAASCAYTATPILPAGQIPPMTTATTGGLTFDGNNLGNVGGSGAPAWALSTSTLQWNQGGTGWVTVQFPAPFVPSGYSITGRSDAGGNAYFPKSRTFQGWNGSAWVDLDQVTNEPAWALGETRTRTGLGTTAYSLYRVNVTASQGGTYLHMRLLQIYQ